MYRVYQDPLGTSVEQSNSTVITNKSSASSETEAYKKTIEDLNKEVKALHDKLKMVAIATVCCVRACVINIVYL